MDLLELPVDISIHAPREGGDNTAVLGLLQSTNSIHAPRQGGDYKGRDCFSDTIDFNPRPPRGGRLHIPAIPDFLV